MMAYSFTFKKFWNPEPYEELKGYRCWCSVFSRCSSAFHLRNI